MESELEKLCLELGTLQDEASRRAFLREHPELLASAVIRELVEAVRTGVRVDLPRASALADVAVAIATELNDEEGLGLALRAKANTMWFAGDCRSACGLFDRAVQLLERAGNMSEVGRTLSSSIQSRLLLGEYESAYQAADRAREIFRALGESARVARVELNVANILHRQARYSEALQAYENAYRGLLPHRDREALSVALHNIAVCLIALDDYNAAQEAYARMRSLCEQNEMPQLAAQADYNIAYLHFLRGEYSRALELLRATRDLCQKNGDHYHLGLCDLDASDIYLELNLIQDAADAAQSSFDQFQKLGMNYEAVRSQLNLAVATSLQRNSKRALELFRGAQEMARREQNEVLLALIDLYSATALFEQDRLNEARELCRGALRVFEKAGLPSKHVAARLLLARIFSASSDPAQAERECDYAVRMVEELDAPVLKYQAQFLRGQIFESGAQHEEAYACYQEARSSLETVRGSLQGDELKIGFMRNRIAVYSRLVEISLARANGDSSAEEAFSYVEAAKSRTLQDLILAAPQPDVTASALDGAGRRVQELRKALNWYYHLMEREHYSADGMSKDRLRHLSDQALLYERELCRALLDAEASGSVGSALNRSRTASISDIRRVLGDRATLLEYFAIDAQVYAIVISADSFKILPVTTAPDIARDMRMLQFQLSKFRLGSAYVERFEKALITSVQRHLRRLYAKLVEPVEGFLTKPRLVIVPYGPLHSLPFHALFDGSGYLIDRFSICYAPSASLFSYPHRREPGSRSAMSLILGIDDERMPSVRQEVEAVAAALPNAKLLWAGEATEAALREYGSSSNVIHIATHGYFRLDNPMFSAVRLADSYLTLHDLYRMHLSADFLTLSGCVTGLNVVDEGDELIGLSRGLLYAGAQSLLLSLWEIEDRATCEFMKTFYTRLAASTRKTEAVRSAMLEVRERRPHPYYWAAFKLTSMGLE